MGNSIKQKENLAEQFYDELHRVNALADNCNDEIQLERARITFDIVPKNIRSVLDIGCGDGRITNLLDKEYDVTAMDISSEALKHVNSKKIKGDISAIPFSDKSFDLVMATEVLEHLPKKLFYLALKEMQRVAKHYLIVSVPYREDVYANLTKCAFCGFVYNVDFHLRSFTDGKIKRLFDRFQLEKLSKFGPKTAPQNKMLVYLKYRLMNAWSYSEKVICPHCGRKPASRFNKKNNLFSWGILGLEWRINKAFYFRFFRPRWVLALYTSKSCV